MTTLQEPPGSIDRSVDREANTIDVLSLAEIEDPAEAVAELDGVDPHAASRVLQEMPLERARAVLSRLDPERAADVVTEMQAHRAAELLEELPAAGAADVLEEMDPDDRVDVLDECKEEKHDEIVAALEAEERAEVEVLERYEPDTAGGIMTTEVTSLYEYLNVADAVETLRKLNEELEQMFYVYVVDGRGHLVGVLSMRDLILAQPDTVLRDIMIEGVRSVPDDMDQEQVAVLFRRHGYLAMPVVDQRNRLIGLITVDDIVDVLQEETTEDVHRLFGAGAEERLDSPWFYSFRKRVGWLVVNLGTAFAAGGVVAAFTGMIEALPILAIFMPIIAGMGGNASAQAMAVAVRGISTGHVDRRLLRHVLRREAFCGALTGVVIGVITAAIAFIYSAATAGDAVRAAGLGGVVFASLLINHTLACTTGAGIPFLMKRLGFDPAQSATILATTVTDVVGFLALLGLAFVAARWLGVL
jgi:magnesium transporter